VTEANYIAAMPVGAVENGKAIVFNHDGASILICNSNGQFFAIENKCSHADEVLECGRIRNGWIACPAHGARFDLASGAAMNPPAKDPIKTYHLRLSGETIEVAVG
jgi:3-phenylpropionate/trans-cinnamate dioxygenase ferredoxin subunit